MKESAVNVKGALRQKTEPETQLSRNDCWPKGASNLMLFSDGPFSGLFPRSCRPHMQQNGGVVSGERAFHPIEQEKNRSCRVD